MTESSNKAGEAGFEMCAWSVSLFAKAESSKARALRCAFWAFWLVARMESSKDRDFTCTFRAFWFVARRRVPKSGGVGWGGVGCPSPPSLKTRPAEAHGPKCVLPDAIIIWQNAVGPLRRPRVGWVGAWVGGVGHVFS